MASVLVDLEDISYIDDITDEDLTASDEENSQRTKKRKKNTLVGEKLLIDPNDKLVRELRQERQENKKALYSINEGENQTDRDLETLQTIIKEQEKQKVLQELREERAKLNTEVIEERYKLVDKVKEERKKSEAVKISSLYKPEQFNMTKEKNDKMNKDKENKDIKRKSQENVSAEIEQSYEDEAHADVENDAQVNKTAELNDETDACKHVYMELGEGDHNFTDKSKLVKSDSKSDNKSKGKRQRSPSVGKENVNVVTTPDTTENADKNMFNDENETDTTLLLQHKTPDISDKDRSDFNGAKPKLFTRRVNGHDMQLKELNLEIYPNIETSRQSGKGKAAMKKKTKAQLEGSEQNLNSTVSDIKILVTNEDGAEVIAHMSESTTGTSRDTWKLSSKSDMSSSPSNITISSDTGRSTPLNYLRKMSEDNEGKKSNHLLEQQELYKQQKAKPFQNFTKIKSGLISTGIEGDSKRSYIKAMTIMPDNKLVLFDKKNKCLKLFDKEFNPLDKISITAKYCGLAAVFDETVAATLPNTKKLQFYHINNETKKISRERTHPVEGEFYSITYHHHRLYMLHRVRTHHFTDDDEWEIKRLNINKNTDEMKTLRTFSPGHKDCNLLANDHGLYITNQLENEVLMLKHDGTFLYRHKTELSLPVGITSDRFGNIYVCGGSVTSFIEVIKPDLRRYRMIYKKTSSNPVALGFNKEDNILYVCDHIIGKIIKYRILHNGTVQGLMRSMLISTSSQDSETT